MEEVKIKSIEYIGKRKAYNITMEKNKNFFLANGILTHNTTDAQNALRRTIEKYADRTRFILSCNYRHKIIKPIQSRMTCFHFAPLTNPEMNILIDRVCTKKSIIVPPEIREILFRYAKGDARRVINPLQSASMLSPTISKEVIQVFTQTPDLDTARLIVNAAISGNFNSAFDMCITSFINKGFDHESICLAFLDVVRGTYVFNWKKILGEDKLLFFNYLKSLNIDLTNDTQFIENGGSIIVKSTNMSINFNIENNNTIAKNYIRVSKSSGETYDLMIDHDFNVYKPVYISSDRNTNNRLIATINAIVANHSHYMGQSNPIIEFSGILAKISMIQSIQSVEQVL